ncbi:MAG: AMP-binding protein [Gammaproteobacteria bacterium]
MSQLELLPLLGSAPLDTPIAWQHGRWITRAAFLAHAAQLAERLPDQTRALVLCTDRYHFLVAFAALLLRAQTALLPPSTAPRLLDDIGSEHAAYRIDDAWVEATVPTGQTRAGEIPQVAAEQVAALLFTSGSTGRPKPQAKTWAELQGATARAMIRFGVRDTRHNIVATVPAQHSYGLESSALYALLGPNAVHSGQPLYPADVCAALAALDAPRMLVTTPLHLDVCLRAELDWPEVAQIVSATAPLERTLAKRAEHTMGCALHEVYGCSEAGAIASRRSSTETAWLPYTDVSVVDDGGEFWVRAPYLPTRRPLSDLIRLDDDGRFTLLGRSSEQVKIAGKRISLAELNRHLLAIEGVEQGSFVMPDAQDARLAAVVVAPTLKAQDIRAQLATALDPVFLPRPLVRVPELRRTGTGKLQRTYLLDLIAAHLASRTRRRA